MGTRAVITFKDKNFGRTEKYSVYQHYDGSPDSVAESLVKAQTKAWGWPRFEASDFAAAYIAANKEGAGNLYLTSGPQRHFDLEFAYEVTFDKNQSSLIVETFVVNTDENDKQTTMTISKCSLSELLDQKGRDWYRYAA